MERDYYIWANEHRGWWRQNRHGYTERLSEAGRFTQAQAFDICANAIRGTADRLHMLPDLPVRIADVEAFTARYFAAHPERGTGETWQ